MQNIYLIKYDIQIIQAALTLSDKKIKTGPKPRTNPTLENACIVVIQSLSPVGIFVTPWTTCSMSGSSVLHYLPEFPQAPIHRVSDAIQPSHPLLFPSPLAFNLSQHQGLFHRVGCFPSGDPSIGASTFP